MRNEGEKVVIGRVVKGGAAERSGNLFPGGKAIFNKIILIKKIFNLFPSNLIIGLNYYGKTIFLAGNQL